MVFFAAGHQGCDIGLDGYASHAMVTAVGGFTRRGCSFRSMDFGNKIEVAGPVSSPDGAIGGTLGPPSGTSGAAALVTHSCHHVHLHPAAVVPVSRSSPNALAPTHPVDAGRAIGLRHFRGLFRPFGYRPPSS